MRKNSSTAIFKFLGHQPQNLDHVFQCFEFFIQMMQTTCAEFTSNREIFKKLSKTEFHVAIAEPVSICGLGMAGGTSFWVEGLGFE